MGHNAELYIVGYLRAPGFILTRRILFPLPLRTERGRRNWQNASGYNERSKVEAAISRYKHVIADTLKSRDDARLATEIAIAVKSLNRMRDLGQAICSRVRVAQLIPRRRQSTLRKLYATKCAIGRQVGRDVELWSGLCRARNLARRNLKRNGRESPGRPGVPGARVWLGEGRLRHGETRDPGPGPEVRSPVPRHQRQGLSTEGLRPRRHARSQAGQGRGGRTPPTRNRVARRGAGYALRSEPLVAIARFPGHGRGRQGQYDQARHVRRESAGVPGRLVQAAHLGGPRSQRETGSRPSSWSRCRALAWIGQSAQPRAPQSETTWPRKSWSPPSTRR